MDHLYALSILLGRHMEELVVPGDGEEGVRFFGKNRRRSSYWEKIEAALKNRAEKAGAVLKASSSARFATGQASPIPRIPEGMPDQIQDFIAVGEDSMAVVAGCKVGQRL